jgi:hypothetical protein
MFGDHFYHQRIRNAVAVFGSLFNNIKVVRKNTSGASISQVKVPLSYAPKRDFLSRLDAMADGEQAERSIAIKLPRMSFEIVAMQYDALRQLPKVNNCVVPGSTYGESSQVYTPVPYNINFQLNVYAKGQDDALQIVEQILPYFTPSYTLTMKPLEDFDGIKEDTPVTLQGITFSDDYEAPLEARRTVIYTLDFEMKISMYKAIATATPIITQYDIENADLDGNVFFNITDSAAIATNTTKTINEDTKLTVDNYQVTNAPLTTHGLQLGTTTPSNGTATVTYSKRLVSASGIIVAVGEYTYQPDSDFSGTDTFTIDLLYGDSAEPHKLSQTINITINAVQDVTSTSLGPFSVDLSSGNPESVEDVSGNDPFTNPTYTIVSQGTRGVASISSAGILTYGASTAGTDTIVYGVTPVGGIRENVTVTYNNTV